MKKPFKSIAVIALALTLLFSAAACAKTANAGKSSNLEGTLEEILGLVYEKADLDANFRSWIDEGLVVNDINSDNEEYHLGKTGIKFEEAIISEPVMMPSAYALCLIRAEKEQDIEALKTEIKDSVNPNKWICVGVDESNILVDNVGDIVMLVMSNENAQALMDAFKALEA